MSAAPGASLRDRAVEGPRQGPALAVQGVSKRFGGVLAVSGASFEVTRGRTTALVGPNGAGKTTLFNLITNLLQPSEGRVMVEGQDVSGFTPARIARLGVIRTFQSARVFPGMTVLENVMAGAHRTLPGWSGSAALWLPGSRRTERSLRQRALALLDLVGLADCREMAATDLPMGSQKQLEVIRALMAEPRLLLLDEPAAGLNDTETNELAILLCAVRDLGITLVVIDHNMPLVMRVADQVVVLDAGSVIAAGDPVQVRNDPVVIRAYTGLEAA